MSEATARSHGDVPAPDPRRAIDKAVIAPRPTRRYRAAMFQTYVLVASVAFVSLAVLAHTVAYFPLDLAITRWVQNYHGQWFAQLMYSLSWIGFYPQVAIMATTVCIALFVTGLRWEAVSSLIAACGVGIGTLVKLVVYRPRPSPDLIRVFAQLPSSGFPSGHVLEFTAFGGFLTFLTFTLLKPSALRVVLLVIFCSVIGLMGLSRIYQGQHWFSDVMGAYLFGSLWLMLTIRIYRWGKARYFVTQPVAKGPVPAQ